LANEVGRLGVRQPHNTSPLVWQFFDAPRPSILAGQGGIAEDLKLRVVMSTQNSLAVTANHMVAEICRKIADPQAPPWIVIDRGQGFVRRGDLTETLAPIHMLRKDRLRRDGR